MLRLLTPDLDAVEEVDLGAEHFDREVAFFKDRLEEAEREDSERAGGLRILVESMAAEAAEYAASQDADRLRVTIGYIPAAVLTAIRQRLSLGTRGKDNGEAYSASMDADRQMVRWGLRGWRGQGNGQMATETEPVHGRSFQVAAWEAVDAIERSGLLRSLAALVAEYNDLSAEKKSRSSAAPGLTATSSTAETAPESEATLT